MIQIVRTERDFYQQLYFYLTDLAAYNEIATFFCTSELSKFQVIKNVYIKKIPKMICIASTTMRNEDSLLSAIIVLYGTIVRLNI
jgi:hypothetical protein